MAAIIEKQTSGFDKLLILVAVALLLAGIYGFYYFTDDGLKSTGAMFGGVIAAVVVFFQSQPGKDLWAFARLSWREMKKVVSRGDANNYCCDYLFNLDGVIFLDL